MLQPSPPHLVIERPLALRYIGKRDQIATNGDLAGSAFTGAVSEVNEVREALPSRVPGNATKPVPTVNPQIQAPPSKIS